MCDIHIKTSDTGMGDNTTRTDLPLKLWKTIVVIFLLNWVSGHSNTFSTKTRGLMWMISELSQRVKIMVPTCGPPGSCWPSGADHRKSIKAPRVTGLCEGNSPVTGEFPAQRASNAENVSIWWCHHDVSLRWFILHPCYKLHCVPFRYAQCLCQVVGFFVPW